MYKIKDINGAEAKRLLFDFNKLDDNLFRNTDRFLIASYVEQDLSAIKLEKEKQLQDKIKNEKAKMLIAGDDFLIDERVVIEIEKDEDNEKKDEGNEEKEVFLINYFGHSINIGVNKLHTEEDGLVLDKNIATILATDGNYKVGEVGVLGERPVGKLYDGKLIVLEDNRLYESISDNTFEISGKSLSDLALNVRGYLR